MRVGEAQSKNRDGVKVYSQTLPDILSLQGSELGEILIQVCYYIYYLSPMHRPCQVTLFGPIYNQFDAKNININE